MLKHYLQLAVIALIAFLASGQPLYAQDSINSAAQYDQRAISARQPSASDIDAYKHDSDYNYDRFENPESFWDIVMRWLYTHFGTGFFSWPIIKYVLYALSILLVVYIVLSLLGIEIKGLFFLSRKTQDLHPDLEITTNDIHDTKLDDMLAKYLETDAWREATRVMYLMVLRHFNAIKLIQWQTGKTNFDYYYELPNSELKHDFKKMVLAYEYVWYGEFQLSQEQFAAIKKQYHLLYQYQPKH